ncbi:MAG: hypothetical protein AABY32_04110 [Nanoarchaeota archaeon]
MKIRNGFVSNSSSSSFIVCFKGKTLKDCFNCMKNHKEVFNIEGEYLDPENKFNGYDWIKHTTSLEEIINILKPLYVPYKNDKYVSYVTVRKLEDLIQEQKDQLPFSDKYYIEKLNGKIKKLEKSYNKGLKSVLLFRAGDTDKGINIDPLRNILDSEGYQLECNYDDLIIFYYSEH